MINDPVLLVALGGSLLGCLVSVFAGIRFFKQERERARGLTASALVGEGAIACSGKVQLAEESVDMLEGSSNAGVWKVVEKELGNMHVVQNRWREIAAFDLDHFDVGHIAIGMKLYSSAAGTNRVIKEDTDESTLYWTAAS